MCPTNHQCSVCYDELHTDLTTFCGHGLCVDCYQKMKGTKCPVCRTDMDECDEDE